MYRISHVDELFLLQTAPTAHGRRGHGYAWVDSSQHLYQYGICIDSLDVKEYLMKNGDNPASIFSGLGFTALKADSISRASTHVLDPTKLRAGMHYYTFSTVDSLETIRYIAFAKSLTDYAVIDLTGDTINAYEFNKPITLKKNIRKEY